MGAQEIGGIIKLDGDDSAREKVGERGGPLENADSELGLHLPVASGCRPPGPSRAALPVCHVGTFVHSNVDGVPPALRWWRDRLPTYITGQSRALSHTGRLE